MGIDLGEAEPTPNDYSGLVDPDIGPNNLQNFPSITNVVLDGANVRIQGFLDSYSYSDYKVNFYGCEQFDPSGYGEANVILGSTTGSTDHAYRIRFDVSFPQTTPMPDHICATATYTNTGDTSEFSHFAMLDTDGDGMPDGYEDEEHGGPTAGDPDADPDGDGFSNLDEFQAGTDPSDPSSYLHIIDIQEVPFDPILDYVTLEFPSSEFREYCLYSARDHHVLENYWIEAEVLFPSVGGYQPGTGTNMFLSSITTNVDECCLFQVRGRLP